MLSTLLSLLTVKKVGVATYVTIVGTFLAVTLTSEGVTAIVLGVLSLMGMVFTGIMSFITAQRAAKAVSKVDENTLLTAQVQTAVATVAKSVDGAATAADLKNDQLQEKVERLLLELATEKREAAAEKATALAAATAAAVAAAASQAAALVAQSVAVAAVAQPHAPVAVAEGAVVDNLQRIDVNTADIRDNTARTDETVQELKDK